MLWTVSRIPTRGLTATYWEIGRWIVEYEQGGNAWVLCCLPGRTNSADTVCRIRGQGDRRAAEARFPAPLVALRPASGADRIPQGAPSTTPKRSATAGPCANFSARSARGSTLGDEFTFVGRLRWADSLLRGGTTRWRDTPSKGSRTKSSRGNTGLGGLGTFLNRGAMPEVQSRLGGGLRRCNAIDLKGLPRIP
jgi:hypothetical protein